MRAEELFTRGLIARQPREQAQNGDLDHLEVVIEMLSSEAVKVSPGMPAVLDRWGGEKPLRARVRTVEPYAFTKVSALGAEEKRTNVGNCSSVT